MKSEKGQALLEFVLIMPILLMLLLAIIDFGRILYEKNRLENVTSDVVDMFSTSLTEAEIKTKILTYYKNKIGITIEHVNNDITIELNTTVDIYTPGLDRVLDDPYKLKVSRVIYNE
ncbi:MAG: TadE/TadG family type IV pilus assembly protein [Bacilli bacterium]|nr:TadE/TadG family type IV pilus assembly protein [Bacilli bacterium]